MKPMKSPKGRTFPPLKSTRPIMQSNAVRTTAKPEGKALSKKRIPPSSRF